MTSALRFVLEYTCDGNTWAPVDDYFDDLESAGRAMDNAIMMYPRRIYKINQTWTSSHDVTNEYVATLVTPAPSMAELYRERAYLIAYLASEHPSVVSYCDNEDPDWAVVYISTPAGQMSWHISPYDMDLFKDIKIVPSDDARAQWDGHDNDRKYRRLCDLTDTNTRQKAAENPTPAEVTPSTPESSSTVQR